MPHRVDVYYARVIGYHYSEI